MRTLVEFIKEGESDNKTKEKLVELRDAIRSVFNDYYSNYDFTYSDPKAVKDLEHAFNDLMRINNELGKKLWSEYVGFRGKKDEHDEWLKCRKALDKLGHGGNFSDEEWDNVTSRQAKVPILVSYRNLLKKINGCIKGKNVNEAANENKDKKYTEKELFDIIADTLFNVDGIDIEDDEDIDIDDLKEIIKIFVKGHTKIKVETSTLDYWEDFIDFPMTQNDKVEEETDILPDQADWLAMDVFSVVVDGDVMYMSSQTGSQYNGDYFDFKITLS